MADYNMADYNMADYNYHNTKLSMCVITDDTIPH